MAETEEKGWAYSDSFKDEQEEVLNLCLRAFTDQNPLTRDLVANGQWVDITLRKIIQICDTCIR